MIFNKEYGLTRGNGDKPGAYENIDEVDDDAVRVRDAFKILKIADKNIFSLKDATYN